MKARRRTAVPLCLLPFAFLLSGCAGRDVLKPDLHLHEQNVEALRRDLWQGEFGQHVRKRTSSRDEENHTAQGEEQAAASHSPPPAPPAAKAQAPPVPPPAAPRQEEAGPVQVRWEVPALRDAVKLGQPRPLLPLE
jgi:hypothetical protein